MKPMKNAFMFRVLLLVYSMTPETSIRMKRKRKLKKKKKNRMGTEMGINYFLSILWLTQHCIILFIKSSCAQQLMILIYMSNVNRTKYIELFKDQMIFISNWYTQGKFISINRCIANSLEGVVYSSDIML